MTKLVAALALVLVSTPRPVVVDAAWTTLSSEDRKWRFPDPTKIRHEHDGGGGVNTVSSRGDDGYMNKMVVQPDPSMMRHVDEHSPLTHSTDHYMNEMHTHKKLPEPLHSEERTWRFPSRFATISRQDNKVPVPRGDYMMMMSEMKPTPNNMFGNVKDDNGIPSENYMKEMWCQPNAAFVRHSDTVPPYLDSERTTWAVPKDATRVGPLHDNELVMPKYQDQERTWRFPQAEQVLPDEVGSSGYKEPDIMVLDDDEIEVGVERMLYRQKHHLPDYQPDVEEVEPGVAQDRPTKDSSVKTLLFQAENHLPDDDTQDVAEDMVMDEIENGVERMLYQPKHHLPDFQPDVEEVEPVAQYKDHPPKDPSVKTLLFHPEKHLPDETDSVKEALNKMEQDPSFQPPEMKQFKGIHMDFDDMTPGPEFLQK